MRLWFVQYGSRFVCKTAEQVRKLPEFLNFGKELLRRSRHCYGFRRSNGSMNKYIFVAVTALILGVLSFPAFAQDACAVTEDTPATVTAEWLAEHIGHQKLVLIHIGQKQEYDEGHIPGAVYMSNRDVSTTPEESPLSLQLPTDTKLKEVFEKAGVSNNSRIVLYWGKDWVSPTTRIYFTLDAMGLKNNVSILDGGMPAWTAAGNKLSKDVPQPAKGDLSFATDRERVAMADWLSANLNKDDVKIIDSRDERFYDGSAVGGHPRGGHLPGSKNIPYNSIVDEENRLKDDETLRKMFEGAGVRPYDTVVTYCHIGQQASLVYFAARKLGYKVKLYDGSFQEWSANRELPLEDPFLDKRTAEVHVVSPEWFEARMKDDDLRILDVRLNVYDYFTGHIPNAVHLADAAMRAPRQGYPAQYLEPFFSGRLLLSAGVRNGDKVAVYSDGDGVLGATMMAYILERIGHNRIYFLDGGWRDYSNGHQVTQEYPEYPQMPSFDTRDNNTIAATTEDVKNLIGKEGVKFIDARPPGVFAGETKIWTRNGHIPGAVNIPWKMLVEENNPHKFKPVDKMRKVFADKGIRESDDIIVYCGTSREASLEYLVLKHVLKYPKVRLYEGSWAEYSNHKDLPVETGN
ncbi:MAG: sulfurtransferase [Acidobacteria bacterium]|nr:MAG: sulfurtransferase [Acidobacteriota bacterium]REK02784.1 MAG: sulfurtransferase [Acidobacteriota bacterium]REK13411.1 MAG: sulfurtransferase [Acidobacteriota bacterium]REK41405.1 MAG: sulfurtransferase [Acidobacteriota bacterium]